MFNEIELPPEYAQLNDGTGKCKYLKDNLCSIYDERPFWCNSKLVYEKHFSNKMSFEEFESVIKKNCEILIQRYGGSEI